MKKVHFIILAIFTLFLIAGAAVAIYWPPGFPIEDTEPISEPGTESKVPEPVATEPPKPKYFCPLDGEATTEGNSLRRPLAVMIENDPAARPQSGLSKACTVYETVAEGGVTRFMAIFLHDDVDTIGPVRSAREYYANLAMQYDALYAHCGGPSTIYKTFKNLGVANIDEFANGDAFWRIRSRKAPHNLYTSTNKLREKAEKRGYETDVFFQRPNFKDDIPIESRPDTASVDIYFSRPTFAVRYVYDRTTNRYNRFMGGKPHVDVTYNKQIAPKNIAVQFAPISSIANDLKGRMKMSLTGKGSALVLQDGKVIQATWERQALNDLTRFYDQTGVEIKFNRGQTWIEIVDPSKMQVKF